MNKLNKLYKAILEALGCKVKNDFSVVMVNGNKEYEIKVDHKKVYLPTNDALNVVDNQRAFFHPACESITSKETEIDKVLRKLVTSCVYFSFKPIAGVLLKVANKNTKGLTGKLLEKMKPLKGVSKEVDAEIIDIVSRISMQTEYDGIDGRIINYTLMRGGKTENDEHIYYRCVPSFPFYNEITRILNQNSGLPDTAMVIFSDHNYRVQTLKIIQAIFEIAIPYVEDPSRAEAVALNPIAARMTALLRTFGHIANEINGLVSKFRKEFDGIGVYGVETGWIEQLDDLSELAYLVPPMEYNNYNTAGKTQDPSQDQQYNLFNVMSEPAVINQHQPAVINTQQQAQPQQVAGAPTPPPRMENETYIGMTTLANGLYEFRYQNGNTIRVVCTNDKGMKINESFTNAQGQPFNNNGFSNPWGTNVGLFGGSPITNVGGTQLVQLPNGQFVPVFTAAPQYNDPYANNQNNNNQNNFNNGMTSSSQMTGVAGNWN